jgi:hypothetical protein
VLVKRGSLVLTQRGNHPGAKTLVVIQSDALGVVQLVVYERLPGGGNLNCKIQCRQLRFNAQAGMTL